MYILVITGMSGAGKSHALNKLEDMGYYCVDNFPADLMHAFVKMAKEKGIERAAMCMDCRDADSLSALYDAIGAFRENGLKIELLFLDADDEVLVRRYSQTRRNHPLARDGWVQDGINAERKLLGKLRECADYYIDTSTYKPSELGAALENIGSVGAEKNAVHVQSFGFKRGIPPESDMVFDVRFLPNPFWVESLRAHSGLDKPVREYVMGFDQSVEFVSDCVRLVEKLLPCYANEGKHRLNLSIGCTGGRHRSVCIASEIYRKLCEDKVPAVLLHRDIENDLQGK